MVDVRTQPLIAQQGNIRVEPYAQPSTPPLPDLPPSMQRTLGASVSPTAKAAVDDLQQTGDITPEDVAHLQAAASKGDKESWDLLNALKLPLGIAAGAAALYGATRGGLSLVDAVGKANGMSMYPDQATSPNGARTPLPPEAQRQLEGHNGQKLLPAPQAKITDTTGSRFNQPDASSPVKAIPDLNKTGREVDAAYAQRDAEQAAAMSKAELEKSLAGARSMRLKGALNAAAKAARGIR